MKTNYSVVILTRWITHNVTNLQANIIVWSWRSDNYHCLRQFKYVGEKASSFAVWLKNTDRKWKLRTHNSLLLVCCTLTPMTFSCWSAFSSNSTHTEKKQVEQLRNVKFKSVLRENRVIHWEWAEESSKCIRQIHKMDERSIEQRLQQIPLA